MAEQKIEGVIKAWAKEIKELEGPTGTYYRAGLLIEDKWHNIPAETKEKLEEVKNEAPVGSKIEFTEWKKEGSQYWNYKAGTWKVIEKGTGKRPFNKPNYGYRWDREEAIMNQASIQILSILKSSAENTNGSKPGDIIKTAEKLLLFHNKILTAQTTIVSGLIDVIKSHKEETSKPVVKEEIVVV